MRQKVERWLSATYAKLAKSAVLRRILLKIGIAQPLANMFDFLWFRLSETKTISLGGETVELHAPDPSLLSAAHLASEADVIVDAITEARETDTFYDVGAKNGLYACLLGNTVGEIVAFEPYSPNIVELKRNLKLNELEGNIIPVALFDSAGTTEFQIDPSRGTGTGQIMDRVEESETIETVTVETVRGDSLLESRSLPLPDIVKIDVEGAELNVLRGLEKTLSSCRILYCEVHPKELRNPYEIEEILKQYGFDVLRFSESGSTYMIKATR